jgi:hypothetical protein
MLAVGLAQLRSSIDALSHLLFSENHLWHVLYVASLFVIIKTAYVFRLYSEVGRCSKKAFPLHNVSFWERSRQ